MVLMVNGRRVSIAVANPRSKHGLGVVAQHAPSFVLGSFQKG